MFSALGEAAAFVRASHAEGVRLMSTTVALAVNCYMALYVLVEWMLSTPVKSLMRMPNTGVNWIDKVVNGFKQLADLTLRLDSDPFTRASSLTRVLHLLHPAVVLHPRAIGWPQFTLRLAYVAIGVVRAAQVAPRQVASDRFFLPAFVHIVTSAGVETITQRFFARWMLLPFRVMMKVGWFPTGILLGNWAWRSLKSAILKTTLPTAAKSIFSSSSSRLTRITQGCTGMLCAVGLIFITRHLRVTQTFGQVAFALAAFFRPWNSGPPSQRLLTDFEGVTSFLSAQVFRFALSTLLRSGVQYAMHMHDDVPEFGSWATPIPAKPETESKTATVLVRVEEALRMGIELSNTLAEDNLNSACAVRAELKMLQIVVYTLTCVGRYRWMKERWSTTKA